MKFYTYGKFYSVESADDKNPVIWTTNVFNLDLDENTTIGQLKTAVEEKLLDTNLYTKIKAELEVRGEKNLPTDTAKASDYKFYTYSVYGKMK